MEAIEVTNKMTSCGGPLPELEVPMINTMVACLGSEHKKLNYSAVQLAFAATRLANDPCAATAKRALQIWDDIRRDLWSHLQIEDELIFSWGEAHHAISETLLDTLKNERQQMRKLMADLRELSSGVDSESQTTPHQPSFANPLLALARLRDTHVERHDGEFLP